MHASISGTLLPSASCSTQLSFGAPATETIPFSLCSFRPDPKRVPRKIRYAWPVACQGATAANRLPPEPSDPLLSPYKLSTPSLPPAVSSGLSTLSPRSRLRRDPACVVESGRSNRRRIRIPSRIALVDPGDPGLGFYALGAVEFAQGNQAVESR